MKIARKILRTIAERLARGRVLKRKMIVIGNTCHLLVSPDAQLKYLKFGTGAFDQDLINIAEKYVHSKSNVWDIGANVGVFTFASASIAKEGTVLSVEADIWLANILRKTALLKEYSKRNVIVLPAAVSNEDSVASFLIAQRGRASNSLEHVGGRSQMGGVREKQYVPTIKLDSLLKNFVAPDFVKIDVEGAEIMALQGATTLLNEIRPVFYIETGEDNRNVSDQILQIFHRAKYSAFDKEGSRLTETRLVEDGTTSRVVKNYQENTLFIPNEN